MVYVVLLVYTCTCVHVSWHTLTQCITPSCPTSARKGSREGPTGSEDGGGQTAVQAEDTEPASVQRRDPWAKDQNTRKEEGMLIMFSTGVLKFSFLPCCHGTWKMNTNRKVRLGISTARVKGKEGERQLLPVRRRRGSELLGWLKFFPIYDCASLLNVIIVRCCTCTMYLLNLKCNVMVTPSPW